MIGRRKLVTAFAASMVCVLTGAGSYPVWAGPDGEGGKKSVTLEEIKKLRKKAAHRERRLVMHSDGISWKSSILGYMPGTHTDSTTYSLIHQFNLARYYRTEVAQPSPKGYIKENYGRDGKDGLQTYIDFCRENGYDAIWAMRMNDTHDAGSQPKYRKRFADNKFKQKYSDFLVAKKKHASPKSADKTWSVDDFNPTPHGRWTSVDYSQERVREQAFRIWEEVCRNYEIDGLMFDFFRHLTLFRSTAHGSPASKSEVEAMTDLMRRTRRMADEAGAARGRPILLIVRTPDLPEYARALGIDIERWMKEGLIDVWIATGYFRLQEWEDIVELARKYDIPIWASMSESRVEPTGTHNSIEIYRARAMNMWDAGVDSIYLFNFGFRTRPQFRFLFEIGDPEKLAYLDKMYVPDARGTGGWAGPGYWLKGGDRYRKRPTSLPKVFGKGSPEAVIKIRVGDDLPALKAKGFGVYMPLHLQFKDVSASDMDTLSVKFGGKELTWVGGGLKENMVIYELGTEVKKGQNTIEISYKTDTDRKLTLTQIQLWIKPEYGGTSFEEIDRVRYKENDRYPYRR